MTGIECMVACLLLPLVAPGRKLRVFYKAQDTCAIGLTRRRLRHEEIRVTDDAVAHILALWPEIKFLDNDSVRTN